MTDTTDLMVIEDETPSALAQWADAPTQAWQLADALMSMHPAAKEVGIEGMRTAAQLALLTGANPLPGTNGIHVWKDEKGKVATTFGIGFWRGEAERAGGLLWIIPPRLMTDDERKANGIAPGVLAAICSASLRSDVFSLRAQARQFGDELGFEDAKREVARTGIGIANQNEYAKKGRPQGWSATERAERDLLRKLTPIGTSARQPVYRDWSPGIFVDPERPKLTGADGGDYTKNDLNADLGFTTPKTDQPKPAPIAEGEWDDDVSATGEIEQPVEGPTGDDPIIDPVAAFVATAETLPGVEAVNFANGRLTAWVNYVTADSYDPAHGEFLTQVLDRYCSAVADNGHTHTKADAEKARADYQTGLAALNDEQDDLFGAEYDARQEEVKADLATAQGKAN